MAKQVTKKQQVNNQVANLEVDNQVVKLKVKNQAAKPEIEHQEAKVEVSEQAAKPQVDVQAAKVEAGQDVVKPEEKHSVNLFNFVWDEWFNSVTLAQDYQREIENIAFKSLEFQKDIWVRSLENLEKAENEISELTDHAKSYFIESLKDLSNGSFSSHIEEWNNQVEVLTNQLQQLYGTPSRATSSLVGKSLDQIETTWKTTIHQQQKSREDAQILLKNYIDQIKATNQVLLNTCEATRGFN